MNSVLDLALNVTERLTRSHKLVTRTIDFVANRALKQVTAQACGEGMWYCGTECAATDPDICRPCGMLFKRYASNPYCITPSVVCATFQCCSC